MKRTLFSITLALATILTGYESSSDDGIKPITANESGRFRLVSVAIGRVSGTTPDLRIYEVKDTQGTNDFVVFAHSSGLSSQYISRPTKNHSAVSLEDK